MRSVLPCARKSVPEFVRKAAADPAVDATTRQVRTTPHAPRQAAAEAHRTACPPDRVRRPLQRDSRRTLRPSCSSWRLTLLLRSPATAPRSSTASGCVRSGMLLHGPSPCIDNPCKTSTLAERGVFEARGPVCCRDACLRARGFEDPFRQVKQEEDAKALALLPAVLRCQSVSCLLLARSVMHTDEVTGFGTRPVFLSLEAHVWHTCAGLCRDLDSIGDDTKRMELALRGVFAGNIFDLGAAESTALFNAEGGVRTTTAAAHGVAHQQSIWGRL